MECFKCGVSEERVQLFDAISNEGVVKVCRDCSVDENLPIIRKPSEKKEEKKPIDYNKFPNTPKGRSIRVSSDPFKRQNIFLKDIANSSAVGVAENVDKSILVDNLHWVLMRARRMRKVTDEKLAREIGEPIAAIKMLERGIFPRNYKEIIQKIEMYLKVRLFKTDEKRNLQFGTSFDPTTTRNLTIADLQRIKKEKEMKSKEGGIFEGDFAFDGAEDKSENKEKKKRGLFGFLKRKKKDESKSSKEEKKKDEEDEDDDEDEEEE